MCCCVRNAARRICSPDALQLVWKAHLIQASPLQAVQVLEACTSSPVAVCQTVPCSVHPLMKNFRRPAKHLLSPSRASAPLMPAALSPQFLNPTALLLCRG